MKYVTRMHRKCEVYLAAVVVVVVVVAGGGGGGGEHSEWTSNLPLCFHDRLWNLHVSAPQITWLDLSTGMTRI